MTGEAAPAAILYDGRTYFAASAVSGFLTTLAEQASELASKLGEPAVDTDEFAVAVAHYAVAEALADAATDIAVEATGWREGRFAPAAEVPWMRRVEDLVVDADLL